MQNQGCCTPMAVSQGTYELPEFHAGCARRTLDVATRPLSKTWTLRRTPVEICAWCPSVKGCVCIHRYLHRYEKYVSIYIYMYIYTYAHMHIPGRVQGLGFLGG